jgi:hypothetical protein
MTLAAFDGDALYQLVILVLLGGGGLVKKFIERNQAGEGEPGEGESATRRQREETLSRLAEFERGGVELKADPFNPSAREASAREPVQLYTKELAMEPILLEEPFDASLATREVSIEGGALEEFSLEGGVFETEMSSKEPLDLSGRMRASVFEDIEQSVSHDITEHVAADMAGGVRGEATEARATSHKRSRARRGWRAAVIAAEVLGSPVCMRGPASQPAGLRDE